jgi:ribonuclease-3
MKNLSSERGMKTFVSEAQKFWPKLEESLGHSFQDKALLAEALTHRSFANEYHAEKLPDNERLEFLGDAVLDLVTSEYLMVTLPEAPEGQLTRIRAEVVSMPGLARIARSLDVGSAMLLGKGEERSGVRQNSSLLADAVEALIGAVFTDGGFASAKAVVLPLFVPLLEEASKVEGQDFKSRLQEMLQASQRALPVYRLANACGPSHERIFHVEVIVDDTVISSGQGRTKKSAEQVAAELALIALSEET